MKCILWLLLNSHIHIGRLLFYSSKEDADVGDGSCAVTRGYVLRGVSGVEEGIGIFGLLVSIMLSFGEDVDGGGGGG